MIWKPFSEKQRIFLDYLFEKIGFSNQDFINGYKNKLEDIYGRYYQELRVDTYPNGFTVDKWIWKYSNSGVIEELLKEVEIKKDLSQIKLKSFNEKDFITATDLANYDYCPASFSISKSFEIEFPTGKQKRNVGKYFHEKLRLINKLNLEKESFSDYFEDSVLNNNTIRKIKSCKLIFSGHDKENKYFINTQENYIGQPDYIFKDPNDKYFVVEEKFKFLKKDLDKESPYYERKLNEQNFSLNSFYSNHLIQLSSYIKYILDYKIDYGILIYWFYDYEFEKPYIHNVSVKVIKSDENLVALKNIHTNVRDLVINKIQNFQFIANSEKCGACIVNKYCAHKTGTSETLQMPYNKMDLNLKYVIFPSHLKRKNKDSE